MSPVRVSAMGLRRRISYQWQLFIPLVAALWICIIGICVWQFRADNEYKKEQIKDQLALINARIISAYEQNYDIGNFFAFVAKYYRDNPVYDMLRVTLYQDGELYKCYGEPIELSENELHYGQGIVQNENRRITGSLPNAQKYFYYKSDSSSDNRFQIITVLPFDNDLALAVIPSMTFFWLLICFAVFITLLAYFSTRYFGRNIAILRYVAERAATDPAFTPDVEYPHDELGDISRQIIQIFNEKSQALERERKEHEVALHAIEEKARSRRELTNNINHELRTPIGVIKGYIDTIIQNPDMDDSSRMHFLTKAQEHVDRLVNLIADVSAITRLEEGGGLISTEDIDFHDLAYTIASDVKESGATGNMTFRIDIPLDCKIRGNYNLLSGMIINLVKNAVSYSKGTLCELVMVSEDDNFYYFEFRDNGVGVNEVHLPYLFDRFYRIDSGRTRKAGGTGLGLPIVLSTIKAHGGEIEVFNGSLGGLCFRFSLQKIRKRR